MKLKIGMAFAALLAVLATASPVFAHCPLCTAATGVLVAGARIAGVDDVIVGTFIAAFTISTALWFNKILVKRIKRQIPLQSYIVSIAVLVMTIVSFYASGLLGTTEFRVFGIEKLLFGMLLGTVITFAGFEIHKLLRAINGHKNYIPMQGIILPISMLVIANVLLYWAEVI